MQSIVALIHLQIISVGSLATWARRLGSAASFSLTLRNCDPDLAVLKLQIAEKYNVSAMFVCDMFVEFSGGDVRNGASFLASKTRSDKQQSRQHAVSQGTMNGQT